MSTPHSQPLNIAVLISGNGSNLQAIIDAAESQQLAVQIQVVISNRKDAFGLQRAAHAGIPTVVVDHKAFPSRHAFDQALLEKIEYYAADLIVLAGFMRILTPAFVQHFRGRLVNIHPSLLPQFTGLNTHQRALDAGVEEHGASVHFVTEALDGGPVIAQITVPVLPHDNRESLAQRVLEKEHLLYPAVIDWFADRRVSLQPEGVLLDRQLLSQPVQLHESH